MRSSTTHGQTARAGRRRRRWAAVWAVSAVVLASCSSGGGSAAGSAAPGAVINVAGSGISGFDGDGGRAVDAKLDTPSGLALTPDGSLLIADRAANRVRKVDKAGRISTVAGNGQARFDGDGGPANQASLSHPGGLAVDRSGNLFIADTANNRVRKVDKAGRISTVAGNGTLGAATDGVATASVLNQPGAVAVAESGALYIADSGRIRKVDQTGQLVTIAGGGSVDPRRNPQPGRLLKLGSPTSLAVRTKSALVAALGASGQLVDIDEAGMVSVVGGNGDIGPADVAGHSATDIGLPELTGLTSDGKGNLYVAEGSLGRVLRIDAKGVVQGLATLATAGPDPLTGPGALAAGPSDSLFVAETTAHQVSRVPDASKAAPKPTTTVPVAPTDTSTPAQPVPGHFTYVHDTEPPLAAPWSALPAMYRAHSEHTATVLGGPQCRAVPAAAWCGRVLVAGGYGPDEIYDPLSDRWATTGGLATSREYHTATLLDGPACQAPASAPAWCGHVLVTGGGHGYENFDNTASSVEVYDPAGGSWSAGAPLASARGRHAAAVLPDGRVLIAGGALIDNGGGSFRGNKYTPVAESEIYDPATSSWSAAAPLPNGGGPTRATVLDGPPCRTSSKPDWCGRVLAVTMTRSTVPDGEVYDPATGGWSAVKTEGSAPQEGTVTKLIGDRGLATVTSLADGAVLVAGGDTSLTRRYDPATNAWRQVASMPQPRAGESATRVEGPPCADVSPLPPPCGQVLVVGGASGAPPTLFDPAAGRWTEAGTTMPGLPGNQGTLLADGRILITGGDIKSSASQFSPQARLYDPFTADGRPSVGAIGPTTGPLTGGSQVIIRGQGFDHVTGVAFGETAATSYRVESPTRVVAVAPSHGAGTVGLAVSTRSGRSPDIGTSRFTYAGNSELPRPVITAVDPMTGAQANSNVVTITGSGFVFPESATDVSFGDAPGSALKWISESVLTVLSPPGTIGTVGVTVHTPAGDSPPSNYSYGEGSWSTVQPLSSIECGPAPSEPTGASFPCPGRFHETATVLDGAPCRKDSPPGWCGRVLVTGGSQGGNCEGGDAMSYAALYDPSTGRWSSTAPLKTARQEHTATLLPDGRVLVVGGKTGDEVGPGDGVGPAPCARGVAGAEIYDPAAQQWSPAGVLNDARFAHTATLLPDGDVLVAGGSDDENERPAMASAEIWHASSRTFEAVAPMGAARANHTATLLGDGAVMVAGGLAGGVYLTSAELFDPGPRTWRPTGSMAVGRAGHTATLLEGAGCMSRCGNVLVAGGGDSSARGRPLHFTTSAELYDPVAGQWLPTGIPTWARGGHTANLLPSGKVLVAGAGPVFPTADQGFSRTTATAELFDPATGRWTPTGSLREGRGIDASVVLGGPQCRESDGAPRWCGSVLVIGGGGPGNGHDPPALASVERYAPGPPDPLAAKTPGADVSSARWLLLGLAVLAAGAGVGIIGWRRRSIGAPQGT